MLAPNRHTGQKSPDIPAGEAPPPLHERIRLILDFRGELKPLERLMLLTIAYHINRDKRSAWPSQKTLGEETGMPSSSLKRAIKGLIAKRILQVTNRNGNAKKRQTNEYRIRWSALGCKGSTSQVTGNPTTGHSDPLIGSHRPLDGGHREPLNNRREQLIEQTTEQRGQSVVVNEASSEEDHDGQETVPPEVFLEEWNDFWLCKDALTPALEALLRERAQDPRWRLGWRKALEMMGDCPFLCGDNETGWKADIGWFLKPDSVSNILSGKYAPRKTRKSPEYERDQRDIEGRRKIAESREMQERDYLRRADEQAEEVKRLLAARLARENAD